MVLTRSVHDERRTRRRLRLPGVQRALAPPVPRRRRAVCRAAALFPAWLPKVVMSKKFASNRDIIVSVFMRGGADGLSIVRSVRRRELLHVALDDRDSAAGFDRPRRRASISTASSCSRRRWRADAAGTGGLMPAFQATGSAVVHATGQLNNSRSHFDAQRYMEVGKPVDPALVTGWLGRHLASIPPLNPTAPLRALGVANGLQKTLVGGAARRCRSPIRRTTRSAAPRRRRRSVSRSCRRTMPAPRSRCTRRRSTRRTR